MKCAAALALALVVTTSVLAADVAADFLVSESTMACDKVNESRGLRNSHAFKTIEVLARWHAAGGKERTERFIIPPGEFQLVGCAADKIEIVEARFTEF